MSPVITHTIYGVLTVDVSTPVVSAVLKLNDLTERAYFQPGTDGDTFRNDLLKVVGARAKEDGAKEVTIEGDGYTADVLALL